MAGLVDIITPLELQDPRRATETVHRSVRELIYSGVLPAGTILSQVELSKALGVSRTPLREAIRMLQEEGLIEAEPNRRCRVAGFDAADVDATYGSRIMLEALGMRLTLPTLGSEGLARALDALLEMEADPEPRVSVTWHDAHYRFHGAFTANAPAALRTEIASGARRANRYVRQLNEETPAGWSLARDDHRTIYEAVESGRHDEAITTTCRHFARTVVTLLANVVPDFEPAATRAAVGLVARTNLPEVGGLGGGRRRGSLR